MDASEATKLKEIEFEKIFNREIGSIENLIKKAMKAGYSSVIAFRVWFDSPRGSENVSRY